MNYSRKVIHVMLCGLVLFFFLVPAIASAETDTSTTTTTADPVAGCITGQTPADVTAVINRCGELETKLNILMEKLRVAQGQDAESIMKDILALKTELRSCQVKTPQATKVVTPGIKNPCDELTMLKDSLAQFEKMNFACQQGKPLEESPCARLSRLEIIYKEMNDKLAGTTVDKSSPKLMESVASIANEIESLKQKCRGEKLDSEKVDTLYDIEKAYRAKQKAIVEGTYDANMQGDLAKVEDEKKKLLNEFALRTSDLDARKSTIIRKLQIKDGTVIETKAPWWRAIAYVDMPPIEEVS